MTFDEVEEIDVISPRPLLEHEIGQTLASEEYHHCLEQLWQFIEEKSENPEIQHYLLERILLLESGWTFEEGFDLDEIGGAQ